MSPGVPGATPGGVATVNTSWNADPAPPNLAPGPDRLRLVFNTPKSAKPVLWAVPGLSSARLLVTVRSHPVGPPKVLSDALRLVDAEISALTPPLVLESTIWLNASASVGQKPTPIRHAHSNATTPARRPPRTRFDLGKWSKSPSLTADGAVPMKQALVRRDPNHHFPHDFGPMPSRAIQISIIPRSSPRSHNS